MSETGEIKIFSMNDCDWVAARSLDEAKKYYVEEMNCEIDEEEMEPGEEAGVDELRFHDSEDTDLGDGTFAEVLERMIARGDKFPCLFATTEY